MPIIFLKIPRTLGDYDMHRVHSEAGTLNKPTSLKKRFESIVALVIILGNLSTFL